MRLVAIGLLALFSVASLGACSSEQPTEPSREPWPDDLTLRGTYEAKGEGTISKITFTKGGEYILRGSSCASSNCEEHGRYALDAKTRALVLTTGGGASRSMRLDVVAAAKNSGGLTTKTLPTEDLTGDQQSLVEPGTVQNALVDGQPVELVTFNGTCLLSQIQTGLVDGAEGKCGVYEDRPECDSNDVVSYYWNDISQLISDTISCGGCAGALTASAIVAVGGTVASDGLLSLPATSLGQALTAWGCYECWQSLEEAGVVTALDCALSPCAYSESGNQKLCQMSCDTAYAYLPQVGTQCQCTNDAVEACCRINCGAYPDSEIHADDCMCHRKQ